MTPQRPPSAPVSLPGIHEMFPEYLMKTQASQNAGRPPAYGQAHPRGAPGNIKPSGDFYPRPPSRSSRPLDEHARAPGRRFTSDRAAQPDVPHTHLSAGREHGPYAAPRPPPPHGPTNAGTAPAPTASAPAGHRIDLGHGPTYSFSVFRSDPATASLEHITSSTTLRSHPSVSQRSQATGVADGSVPAFTVVVSDPVAPPQPSTSRGSGAPAGRGGSGYASSAFSVAPLPAAGCSSFPVADTVRQGHDPQGGFKTFARDPYLGRAARPSTGDKLQGADKLHQCRHCLKRFNRPSSLRIHANTHTGARPFQCPFPACGREFNVNSNMRRHYRNHARAGASGSPPRLTLSPSDDGRQPLPPSSPSADSARLSPGEDSDGEMLFAMDGGGGASAYRGGRGADEARAAGGRRPRPRSLSPPACAAPPPGRAYASSSPAYAQVPAALRPAFTRAPGGVCGR